MTSSQLQLGVVDEASKTLTIPEDLQALQPQLGVDDASPDAFSCASQGSVTEIETSLEWVPTPQVQHKLHSLNNFLRNAADGEVSPIRSQLCTDASRLSSSSSRYYRRKAVQAVETVLEAIAPEQSSWLFQRVTEKYLIGRGGNMSGKLFLARLIKLYEDTDSWYTRQQILMIFVCDHSKSELLTLILVSQNEGLMKQGNTLFFMSLVSR